MCQYANEKKFNLFDEASHCAAGSLLPLISING